MTSVVSHPPEEDLLSYADGEIPSDAAEIVRTHLAVCGECRQMFAELQVVSLRYAGMLEARKADLGGPPKPWANIRSRLLELDAGNVQTRRAPLFGALRWAAAAACIAAAAYTIQHTTSSRMREPGPAQTLSVERGSETPPPAPAAPSALPPAGEAIPRVASPVYHVGPADELRALAALHRIGVGAGEPLEVRRDADAVVVSALGFSPDRRERIRVALADQPRVQLRFEDPQPVRGPNPRSRSGVTEAAVDSALRRSLEDELGGSTEAERYTQSIMEASENMLAHAHALRDLAERFPPDVEAAFDGEHRALLLGLRRDHASALAAGARRLQPLLQIATGPLAPVPSGSTASWQSAAADAAGAARNFDQTLSAALAGSEPQNSEATITALRDAYRLLAAATEACARLSGAPL